MGGVDLIDKRDAAYHLDRKSTIRIYLHIFLHLIDVACILTPLGFKPSFLPSWLEVTQVVAEQHQLAKQVPKESISLSKVTYHNTFQSFKVFGDDVSIATKKGLTLKLMFNAQNVEFSYVWSEWEIALKSIILKKRS